MEHISFDYHKDDRKGNYDSGTLLNNPPQLILSNGFHVVGFDEYKKDSMLFLNASEFIRPDGSVLERLSDGEVRIIYANNDVYEGQVTADDKRHGKGKMTYFNGIVYEGDFLNDQLPCGQNGYTDSGGTVTVDGHTYSSICTKDELYLSDSENDIYSRGTVVFHPKTNNTEVKKLTKIIYSNSVEYEGEVIPYPDSDGDWRKSIPKGMGTLSSVAAEVSEQDEWSVLGNGCSYNKSERFSYDPINITKSLYEFYNTNYLTFICPDGQMYQGFVEFTDRDGGSFSPSTNPF